jgi:hypothetical protein
MPLAPHSPAPWSSVGDRVSAANGDPVCDLLPPFPNDGDVFAANRCLIVHAPDMLEALKAVRNHAFTRVSTAIAHTISTVIDKAEGR